MAQYQMSQGRLVITEDTRRLDEIKSQIQQAQLARVRAHNEGKSHGQV